MTPTLALLGDLGGGEILVIGVLALLLFGSKRLPELGRAFGRAMREFKRATSGVEQNLREVMREDPLGPALKPAPRRVSRGGSAATPPAATVSPPPSPATDPAVPLPPPTESREPPSGSSPQSPQKKSDAEDEIAS